MNRIDCLGAGFFIGAVIGYLFHAYITGSPLF